MTTPTLSHEQACIVRIWLKNWLDDMADCYHLLPIELFDPDDELDAERCQQALAEYDAETERLFDIVKQYASHSCHSLRALNDLRQHVAGLDSDWSKDSMQGSWIETSELKRLQALERKIEAFLDWLRDNADVDGVGRDTHATRFSIDLDAALSQDVMRKAFEMVEVAEEEV